MPNWACEFDSHLGHSKTEAVDFQRLPFSFSPTLFISDKCSVQPIKDRTSTKLTAQPISACDEKIKLQVIVLPNARLMAKCLTLKSMAMTQAAPTATERSEVCRRSGACSLEP